MKNKFFTYFTVFFLLLLFFAKDIFPLSPSSITEEWVLLHEYDSEDEPGAAKNGTEGNLKIPETYEFLARHEFVQNITILSQTQTLKLRPVNSFFERTFFLSIPTPPPDTV
ncbi:MAG: hypothetical protein JSS70_07740 [Bacteroidetes bacterium]|nr:hypothetical protein [Bacteroidota bacterium]